MNIQLLELVKEKGVVKMINEYASNKRFERVLNSLKISVSLKDFNNTYGRTFNFTSNLKYDDYYDETFDGLYQSTTIIKHWCEEHEHFVFHIDVEGEGRIDNFIENYAAEIELNGYQTN